MSKEVTDKKISKGFAWKLLERFANQGLTLVISLVLSRILGPAQYAKLAIITIFISIADAFVQSGLSTALIQKKEEPDAKDYSSVFFINLAISAVSYVIIFFISPFLLGLLKMSDILWPLRVTALVLLFGAFTSVQTARVSRKLEFRKIFTSSIIAGAVSGTVSIAAAIMGMGIWALVLHFTLNRVIIFIVLLITERWMPGLEFSGKSAGKLFSFGWKVMVSSLIDTIYQDTRSLFVKQKYKTDESSLGIYNKGQQIPQILVTSFSTSIQAVILPALSAFQNDKAKMKELVKRAISAGTFIVYPMMGGLIVMAKPLVQIILGEEWLPCVPILQIYCLNYAFWPTHSANLQVVNACGRSDKYLIMEILKKIFDFGILLISVIFFRKMTFIAWGSVLSNVISAIINGWPNRKMINYGFREQIKDISQNLIITCIMVMCVYGVSKVISNLYLMAAAQIAAGVVIYFGLSWLLKSEGLTVAREIFGDVLKGKKEKE